MSAIQETHIWVIARDASYKEYKSYPILMEHGFFTSFPDAVFALGRLAVEPNFYHTRYVILKLAPNGQIAQEPTVFPTLLDLEQR